MKMVTSLPCHKLSWWTFHLFENYSLFSLFQFSCSVVFDSLQLHGLQHPRPPCSLPTPRVYSNSCPLSQWCHSAISSSVIPFSSCLQSFPASVLSNESFFHIRWPKHWSFSFSISPSNEYSGLISFMIDWLDLLAVQGTLKSLLQPYSLKASILWHSALATLNFWIFFICGFVINHEYTWIHEYTHINYII